MDSADKLIRLKDILREMGSALVAYSGGVDSAFLAAVAYQALGDKALAVTAVSPSLAPSEREGAIDLARSLGLRHRVIYTLEMEDGRYTANGPDRCYFCKSELYSHLLPMARAEGLAWVVNGANVDDLGDYRPGMTAGQERGVRSPLVEASLTKAEIRELSRQMGLPTWDKPAQPCLSSRIPYGTPVTVGALERIARAEAYLRSLGLREFRVRHHPSTLRQAQDKLSSGHGGPLARIEADPPGMAILKQEETWDKVVGELKTLGYAQVTLDLSGFRSGRLNEALAIARRGRENGAEFKIPGPQ